MRRKKIRAGRSSAVAASSSSSEDDISLGVAQEEAPTPPATSTDATFFSGTSQRRGNVPSQRNQFSRKYEAQWKDDLRCKFVKVLVFFLNYNIIYEVITIEFISFIFRFTNIEAARVISSAFKSLMEIPLFQWSQISKHPEWIP